MELGLFMNTHGICGLIDGQMQLQPLAASEMRPLDVAKRAEEVGWHSLWFSDHVTMTFESTSLHSAADPVTGKRAYPPSPDMLDCLVTMGAVAAVTDRVKLAPSVLVSPYRHPLSDARQLATVDALSGGRLVLGVGVGWLQEEFEALGVPYEHRRAMTEECIEIYKRCWSDDAVSFEGEHYRFSQVSMDPKPVSRPPIVFGGVTKLAARIAAQRCDGFFPTYTDPLAEATRYDDVLVELQSELERVGRDQSEITLLAVVTARVLPASRPAGDRQFAKGTVDEVIADLADLAERGFSHVVVHLDCRSGTMSEFWEQMELIGTEVLPRARQLTTAGGWGTQL